MWLFQPALALSLDCPSARGTTSIRTKRKRMGNCPSAGNGIALGNNSSRDAVTEVKATMKKIISQNIAPGVSYGIVDSALSSSHSNSILFSDTVGFTDAVVPSSLSSPTDTTICDDGENEKSKSATTTDTLFMAYSITKTITSILVLQLAQRNLLHLDDSVSQHLPSGLLQQLPSRHYLNTHGTEITIRMLLNHTSGVPNPLPLDWFFVADDRHAGSEGTGAEDDSCHSHSLLNLNEKRQEAFYNVMQHSPNLQFTPGSDHLYSNVGYWLLEKVIEHVSSGKSYEDVYYKQIALPLGLGSSKENDNDGCCPTKIAFEIPSGARYNHHGTNSEKEQQKVGMDAVVLARGHSPRFSLKTFIFYLLTPKKYWSPLNTYRWSGFRHLIPHGLGYGGMYASVQGLLVILNDLLTGMRTDVMLSADHPANENDAIDRECGVLLSLESKKQMFGLFDGDDSDDDTTPLGWSKGTISIGDEKEHYLAKPGGGLGFHGNIRIYPRLGIATVFLCNGTCVSAEPINAWSDRLDVPFLVEKKARLQLQREG
mmetsp:Transcript_6446/g.14059  ORF Transcript_6446/g.14059 Transcript_6446/m.14059 type:complete len:540 (-) Transcript_6446:81-1700(-)